MGDFSEIEEATKLNAGAGKDGDIMERIIQEVGEMGTYQRWLFVAMMPFCVCFMFVYCVQMFIAATPQQHWCKVPELQHLDIETRRILSIPGAANGSEWDRCRMYDANWTAVLETMSPPGADSATIACNNGWEFLYDDIPYPTVVSERGWVCDRAGYAPLAQSTFFLGSLIGCAVFGWLGDKVGRLPILIVTNVIGCLGGILTVFTQSLWDFTAARFLVGLSNDCCVMMMYIVGGWLQKEKLKKLSKC